MTSMMKGQEGGYSNKFSVRQGDSLSFYISTKSSPFTLTIFRNGIKNQVVRSISSLIGKVQSVPDSSYINGCGWIVTSSISIPPDWTSGLYYAQFPTSKGTATIPFVVRQNNPGSYSRAVLEVTMNTLEAYNNFGGKSLYGFNSTDEAQSYKVSFNRPFAGLPYINNVLFLITWLEKQNIAVEYITDGDLDVDSTFLNHYEVLTMPGHNEYWTKTERTAMEGFLNKGGRFACLGGNTCWWQSRIENSERTLVCYRSANLDPLYRIDNSRVTVNWYNSPVNYPENLLLGSSFLNGGYVNNGSMLPASQGYGGFAAINSQHWIFQGTGLPDGGIFGASAAIVGYEVDGARYTWNGYTPVPTGTDGTPKNYRIVGLSPATAGHATMGFYYTPGGGAVFNAATVNWTGGLSADTAVGIITQNIFNRFIANAFPPEITTWSPSRIVADSINHDWMFMSRRDTAIWQGDSLQCTVFATDPRGESLSFVWKLNNNAVDTTPTVIIHPLLNSLPQQTLTAYVFNNHDTASISWTITVNSIISPKGGSFNQPLQPVFQWLPIAGAAAYHIQLTTDSTFSTITVQDTNTSTPWYFPPSLQYQTAYFWRVIGSKGAANGKWSPTNNFTTVPAPPPAPTLIFPMNDAGDEPVNNLFVWGNSSGADHYEFQIGTDSTFVSGVVQDTITDDTTAILTKLQYLTTFYWRVRANNFSEGSWSLTNAFTTAPPIPDIPILEAPASYTTIQAQSDTILWTQADLAQSYQVELSSDSLFSSLVIDTTIMGTMNIVNGLRDTTTYYWHVMALNGPYESAWSLTWQFSTILHDTLQISAGAHGSVVPAGSVILPSGSTLGISITADPHYHIDTILVDGIFAGSISPFVFDTISSSHTLHALFGIDSVIVSAMAGPNGTIIPSGSFKVPYGNQIVFSFVPSLGYHVGSVLLNGVAVAVDFADTLNAVMPNSTISVIFERDHCNRTIRSGAWSDSTLWSYGTIPSIGDSAVISSPDTVTLSANAQVGAISIQGILNFSGTNRSLTLDTTGGRSGNAVINGTLNFSADSGQHLAMSGDFQSTGIINNSSVGMLGSGLLFYGNGIHTLSSIDTIRTLALENSALQLTLQNDLVIGSHLVLQEGKIYLGNHNLSFDTERRPCIDSGSAKSYIVTNGTGRMNVRVDSQQVRFPVGIDTSFTPVVLSVGSGSAGFHVGVLPGVVPNGSDDSAAVMQTFDVTMDSGNVGLVNMTVFWTPHDEGSRFIRTTAVPWVYDGTAWIEDGFISLLTTVPSSGNNLTSYSATISALIQFGHIIIGNPGTLPAQITKFIANMIAPNTVELEWSSDSEVNSYGFYVERRGEHEQSFQNMSNLIPGAGTTLVRHSYHWIDTSVTGSEIYYYRLRLVNLINESSYSSIIKVNMVLGVKEEKPLTFALDQNYPNPFNPGSYIDYALPVEVFVSLKVYNILGEEIATLVNETQSAGFKEVRFDVTNLGSGVYFYRLHAGLFNDIKKMVVIK